MRPARLLLSLSALLAGLTFAVPAHAATLTIFSENFDGANPGWFTVADGVASPWTVSGTTPFSVPNDAFTPDHNDVGTSQLVTPFVAVPSGTAATFSFRN